MRTWQTEKVNIEEIEFDYDLHAFHISHKESGHPLITIVPDDVDDMERIAKDLDGGSCPVNDGWEQNGTTVSSLYELVNDLNKSAKIEAQIGYHAGEPME